MVGNHAIRNKKIDFLVCDKTLKESRPHLSDPQERTGIPSSESHDGFMLLSFFSFHVLFFTFMIKNLVVVSFALGYCEMRKKSLILY